VTAFVLRVVDVDGGCGFVGPSHGFELPFKTRVVLKLVVLGEDEDDNNSIEAWLSFLAVAVSVVVAGVGSVVSAIFSVRRSVQKVTVCICNYLLIPSVREVLSFGSIRFKESLNLKIDSVGIGRENAEYCAKRKESGGKCSKSTHHRSSWKVLIALA